MDVTIGTFSAKNTEKSATSLLMTNYLFFMVQKIITHFLASKKTKSALTQPNEHFIDTVRKKR